LNLAKWLDKMEDQARDQIMIGTAEPITTESFCRRFLVDLFRLRDTHRNANTLDMEC
jgi:hypothetical protein